MQEWYNDVVIILSGASSIVCRELTPAPSGSIRLIILGWLKVRVLTYLFLLLFYNFAHFFALVCKIGFLFFNFPRFCTIDSKKWRTICYFFVFCKIEVLLFTFFYKVILVNQAILFFPFLQE